MNAKAQTDFVFLIPFILIGLIFFILGYIFLSNFSTQTEDTLTGQASIALSQGLTTLKFMDWIALFVFIIYGLIVVGLSTAGRNNPVMFIFALLIYLPVLIFSGTISNLTQQIENQPSLSAYTPYFPVTFHVLNNLPMYSIVLFFISMGVTFMGVGGGGGQIGTD